MALELIVTGRLAQQSDLPKLIQTVSDCRADELKLAIAEDLGVSPDTVFKLTPAAARAEVADTPATPASEATAECEISVLFSTAIAAAVRADEEAPPFRNCWTRLDCGMLCLRLYLDVKGQQPPRRGGH